jgi:hypothetical protein
MAYRIGSMCSFSQYQPRFLSPWPPAPSMRQGFGLQWQQVPSFGRGNAATDLDAGPLHGTPSAPEASHLVDRGMVTALNPCSHIETVIFSQ